MSRLSWTELKLSYIRSNWELVLLFITVTARAWSSPTRNHLTRVASLFTIVYLGQRFAYFWRSDSWAAQRWAATCEYLSAVDGELWVVLLRGLKGKEGSSSRPSEDDIRANWNTAQDWVWRRQGQIFVAAAKISTVTRHHRRYRTIWHWRAM